MGDQLIIYYGSPGLESQVFQSYMVSSGYKVQVVTTREGAITALDANPASFAIVALQNKQRDLIEQARMLLSHVRDSHCHVFVLSAEDGPETPPEGIDLIPRPYRLSELVRRIQALTKNPRKND